MKHALPLALAACLAATPVLAQEVSNEVLLRDTRSWNGATLPAYPDGPAEITIAKLRVPPGATLTEHLHPVILGGYVLSGELTVRTEHGEETTMRAGEAALEVVNTWHGSRNDGDTATEIIVFYVGTPGVEVTQRRE